MRCDLEKMHSNPFLPNMIRTPLSCIAAHSGCNVLLYAIWLTVVCIIRYNTSPTSSARRSQASTLDSKALASWHRTISKLHTEFSAWAARHSKHIPVRLLAKDSQANTLTSEQSNGIRTWLSFFCHYSAFAGQAFQLESCGLTQASQAFLSSSGSLSGRKNKAGRHHLSR